MSNYEHDNLSESLSRINMENVQRNANGFWGCGCLPIALSVLMCTLGASLPIDNMVVRESVRWASASVLAVIGTLYMINYWKNRNIAE